MARASATFGPAEAKDVPATVGSATVLPGLSIVEGSTPALGDSTTLLVPRPGTLFSRVREEAVGHITRSAKISFVPPAIALVPIGVDTISVNTFVEDSIRVGWAGELAALSAVFTAARISAEVGHALVDLGIRAALNLWFRFRFWLRRDVWVECIAPRELEVAHLSDGSSAWSNKAGFFDKSSADTNCELPVFQVISETSK